MASTTPDRSPLEPVFAGYTHIPHAFAEQFFHGEDRPYGMTLEGVMHRIWHRPAVLGPVFRLLGKLGILVPYNAEDVSTSLVVQSGRRPDRWRLSCLGPYVRFRAAGPIQNDHHL